MNPTGEQSAMPICLFSISYFSGDGRNDSPGFSAMYCTYTLMDHETKDIVYMEIMDKRMTGGNSPAMEKEALHKSLEALKDNNVPMAELVTDAHTSVAAMLSMFISCNYQIAE